ncbi:hypothetical protein TA5113_01246 [Cognatishimia activa]|nr:hypothetical protein TA5113_01246 [Cognatishimia activa]
MRALLGRIWTVRRAVALYAGVLTLGWLAGSYLRDLAIPEMRPMNEPRIHAMVMVALVVFIVAAAIPFVPGAEVGFALLFFFGAQAAPLVFLGMVGAMFLSYSVAKIVPIRSLISLSNWLRLGKITEFLRRQQAAEPQNEPKAIMQNLDNRLARFAVKNRYLVLIILLNTPGNSILGGGGGLAFFAGLSNAYRFWPFLLSVVIAVAPVPLAFKILDLAG